MDDVRPEARKAVLQWIRTADPQYRNRWFLFFQDAKGEQPSSRPATSSSKKLPTNARAKDLEQVQRELDLANWQTCYQVTNNSLGKSLEQVKRRAQGDKTKILVPMIEEIIKSSSKGKVNTMMAEMSSAEVENFTTLMRSLSISYEQFRNAFCSEYVVEYVPKKVARSHSELDDPFASTLSAPIRWAPPRPPLRPRSCASRLPTPQPAKAAPPPKAVEGLLHWASGVEGINSTYRTFFNKLGEVYPSVVANPEKMSFSCGRVVPDFLVGDQFRKNTVFLPCELESRHRLHQKLPTAQPSWHLLYKDGVVYTDTPGPHDRGDLSIYMSDFTNEKTVVKAAKPTLDPFASSITIGMSDYPYHTTTYQDTICHATTMQHQPSLV